MAFAARKAYYAPMTVKRLLVWMLEKLVELHLAVAAVLLVSTLLPTVSTAYTSLAAFAQAVTDNAHNAADDAVYMTRTFMGGSYAIYAFRTYLASAYVIVFYVYLSGLYLFASLLACLLDHKHYALSAVLAFGFSAAIICLRYVPIFDAATLREGAVLAMLGLGIVFSCALMGERLMGAKVKTTKVIKPKKATKPSVRRRVSLDLSE